MKILIVAEDGMILGRIEDLQEYDLDKPLARLSIIEDIIEIIEDQV